MSLAAAFLILMIGAPLGALLMAVAAILLRAERPRRAWTTLALFAPVCLSVLWYLGRDWGVFYPYGSDRPGWVGTVEMIAELTFLVTVPALFLASTALLIPKPAKTSAFVLGLLAFACLGAALFVGFALSNTNFSL